MTFQNSRDTGSDQLYSIYMERTNLMGEAPRMGLAPTFYMYGENKIKGGESQGWVSLTLYF